jgi:hypothetical protein
MNICKNCGYQNEVDDAFCASCGTLLEWAGERFTEPEPESEPEPEPESEPEPEPDPRPEPEPDPGPEPERDKAAFIDRVRSTLGIGEEGPPDGEVPAGEQKQPEAREERVPR